MATRLSFAEFDAKLKSGTLAPPEFRRYLEVDPAADTVRVKFKPGALRDAPPPEYDVDREVYLAERAKQERQMEALAVVGLKRVIAEGDSWFNLPPIIRPQAIADRLSSNRKVAVKNIAHWGDTLAEMLQKKEYLTEIPKFKPDWFIFSGGGNDLQQSLKRGELVLEYDAGRPIDECLSPAGVALLQGIAAGYRTLLNEIAINFPALPSICYAYDFPKPTYKGGKYIGQYLRKKSYPKTTWDAVAKVMIDRLTSTVENVVKAFPNAQFLDCRGIAALFPFFDDMHPNTEGFKALTHAFERVLGVVTALAVEAKPKKRPKRKGKQKARRTKARGAKQAQRRVKRTRRAK